jgi:Ca2+/Na+ antiporter
MNIKSIGLSILSYLIFTWIFFLSSDLSKPTIVILGLLFGVFVYFLIKAKKEKVLEVKETRKNQPKNEINTRELYQKFEVVLVGIFFECKLVTSSRQELIASEEVSAPVYFKRDLDNEYDKNAVFVLEHNGWDLGYVKANETKRIIKILEDQLYRYEAVILKKHKIKGGHGVIVEVNIFKSS